jgi:hypothetical protein
MNVHGRRVRAIIRKELREYRRNQSLIAGMAIIPAPFCVQPLLSVFALSASASGSLRHDHVLLYMLGIPAFAPAFVAAGERQGAELSRRPPRGHGRAPAGHPGADAHDPDPAPRTAAR